MRANIRRYQQVSRESGITSADNHQVIFMLLQGLLDSVAVAKGCILRNDIEGKAKAINKSINITSGLIDGINHKVYPEIGENFDALYRYIQLRLNDATLERSVEPLDEITTLVTPIKDAWLNIPQAEKMKVEAMREQTRGA
ncbi:MAG: flagellar export chaperone FliS [Moritella sp.]|uniref:flagellar export chaperone FliS n=1 Tax=unclassified Moritella TaxID=2637987 RepID=UPI0001569403|nr:MULTISPECIES: flagellar export chaperone FliS [unclassified Moritella]EDM65235.1 Flagellar protein FliS [Moritella sp. PE36]MBL1415411.1 flagellar export chaperone FliS [Moritella sp.]PHR89835.1 MAG: flagellar export chaperone FliS [Moritella sp.]